MKFWDSSCLVSLLLEEPSSAACRALMRADPGVLRRVLAQTEVRFSNSLIEAYWRSLKHQWLFLNALDSVAAVRRHVEFYVSEHNATLPHAAFNWQTPDEMYFGTGGHVPKELAAARQAAIARRLEANRAWSCAACSGPRGRVVAAEGARAVV